MIVRYPTGYYSSVLPKVPSDPTSVTYLISFTDPPRSNLVFQQLPDGISRLKRPFPLKPNRDSVGLRSFTVSDSGASNVGSGMKQYEVGQTLEFAPSVLLAVDAFKPGKLDVRHDTNVLDLDGLGLSSAEVDDLNVKTLAKIDELKSDLAALKQERLDVENSIGSLQKSLNEAMKARDAVAVLDDSEAILEKLDAKIASYTSEMSDAVSRANELAQSGDEVMAQIRSLMQLVR
jgi:hypothetical protein